jgi:hypothetical protein
MQICKPRHSLVAARAGAADAATTASSETTTVRVDLIRAS